MGRPRSSSLEAAGAHHRRLRKFLAALLLAVLCLALIPSIEAPAQTAPWDIEAVQNRLVELGYDVGEVDGLLGPKTRTALRSFQGDRGLPITGLPDGDTQQALLAAEPPQSERAARPSSDDPPRLDAVPLGPVEVAPLAPMDTVTPHEGLSVAQISAEPPGGAKPAADPDRGRTASRGDWLSELGSWQTGLKWAALALGALGAVSLIAAAILKLAKRKTVVAERPRPRAAFRHPAERAKATTATAAASKTAATSTTSRGAHVFGVNVPASGDPETG